MSPNYTFDISGNSFFITQSFELKCDRDSMYMVIFIIRSYMDFSAGHNFKPMPYYQS